jgi:dihydroneopterin aldolase
MIKIHIQDLTFECIIGVLPRERKVTQKVVVDILFEYSYKNKSDFIDYVKITTLVEKIMKDKKFELLEDAVLYIKQTLLKQFKIQNIDIKISKPDILNNCVVSACISKTNKKRE